MSLNITSPEEKETFHEIGNFSSYIYSLIYIVNDAEPDENTELYYLLHMQILKIHLFAKIWTNISIF